jgi:hypothetical protein
MVRLWVDEQQCDIDTLPTIPIDFDAANLTKAEGAREGRSLELTLPATSKNRVLFGSSCDLYAVERFNMEHHTACLEKDGVQILKGTAYLLSTSVTNSVAQSYSIRIKEGGAEWIEPLVHGELSDLEIPFSGSLNLACITNSWNEGDAVRFLLIYRGNYLLHYSTDAILPVERVLLTDDYHPFISIAEMVRAMFAKSGYTVHSSLLDSEFGRSLFMSGDYARTDSTKAKEKCDFFARRSTTTTTTADYTGRVYASKAFAMHTVGPIVDTADPNATDENGKKMSDTFCINDSFQKVGAGNIGFTPIMSVKAGFILHLEYSTEYKIISREKFCGFDTIDGLYSEKVRVQLANNCKDFRDNTSPKSQYRVLVFDHTNNREYQLVGVFDNGEESILGSWSSRSAIVTMPATQVATHRLLYRDSNSSNWTPYTEDWAIYAGYIEERGMLDVEMDFRIAPRDVAAGETLVLDKFWFGGADPGMKLTLRTGTTLRPYFTSIPGYNEHIEYRDIAPRNIRQIDLLTALGEMFNLAFYTDRQRKELYIEPLERLYDEEVEIDWSSRIDHLGEMVISDSGIDVPQITVFTYIDADLATHKLNLENDTIFGRWSFRNPLYGTKDSTKSIGNKLFTTTLNISNIIGSAPSASILQVGDVGNAENNLETAFTPRIVSYKGMRNLPQGESWGAAYRLDKYPYATFVDEQTNLCFDDHNGIDGLHHYHLPTLLRQRDCRKVTLDLYLTTAEIATLFTADGPKSSLRTKFRFNIQGESLLFRLAKVERWDTESNLVRCTFEQELNT